MCAVSNQRLRRTTLAPMPFCAPFGRVFWSLKTTTAAVRRIPWRPNVASLYVRCPNRPNVRRVQRPGANQIGKSTVMISGLRKPKTVAYKSNSGQMSFGVEIMSTARLTENLRKPVVTGLPIREARKNQCANVQACHSLLKCSFQHFVKSVCFNLSLFEVARNTSQ